MPLKNWEETIEVGTKVCKLTVLERAGEGRFGAPKWLCRCECGNELIADETSLRNHNIRSCGCADGREDLTGQKFGMMTALSRAVNDPAGKARWLCRCDCGNEKVMRVEHLRKKGAVPNCGCFTHEQWVKNSTKEVRLRDPKEFIEPGMEIGNLTVIGEAAPGPRGGKMWRCRCGCGREIDANESALKIRNILSCGCTDQVEDLTGRKFGMVTVVSREINSPTGSPQWLCRCDCGNEKVIRADVLKRGNWIPNCGCIGNKDGAIKRSTHTMTGTAIYNVWTMMKQRCLNPNATEYALYGGRGITVCDRWLDFEGFFEDMGAGYQKGLQLDRINNNGPYSPENCRWVTRKENQRNMRRNRMVDSIYGELPMAAVCEKAGISYKAINNRLEKGCPSEFLTVKGRFDVGLARELAAGKEAVWLDEKSEKIDMLEEFYLV